MAEINGATLLTRSLKQHGVEHMFGIVGFPVIPIGFGAQQEGLRYYGMRHEQSAAYAAQAVSYLTGRPGACLVVSGPGMTNAITGLANAWSNCWPMVLIGGSSDLGQKGMGAFQEAPQVEAARPWCKYAVQVDRVERIPFFVEQAVRTAMYGRPGPVYIDMPGDIIDGTVDADAVEMPPRVPDPPRPGADPASLERALATLARAERPLVIVGKGVAYSRGEEEARRFIEATQLPFLPSPMGKGILPDDHPLAVSAARSFALKNADVVFLMGSRFNWIMHFGKPPRFDPNVKVIQLDISAEEIGTNVPAEVGLVGDAKTIVGQLNDALRQSPWQFGAENTWRTSIAKKIEENQHLNAPMLADDSVPMGYYRVLREIDEFIGPEDILVNEGSNTMDIGRQVLNSFNARHRLDAGSFGTMGCGLPYAIAAQAVHPDKHVIAVEGDSAFGFSGMEVEVAARYKMPITFVIVNNNGIGGGPPEPMDPPLPMELFPKARYEKMAECFGGLGFLVERPEEIAPALRAARESGKMCIVNIPINPRAARKPQEFAWLTR